jgi:hypothetical protein
MARSGAEILEALMMRISTIVAIAAAALLVSACGGGPDGVDAPLPELEGKWSSKFIDSFGKAPACSVAHVSFEQNAVILTGKGKSKTWMKIVEVSKKDDLIRLKVINPQQNKAMVLYLRSSGNSIRLAEMRDENDKVSMSAALKDMPAELKNSLASLLKGVNEMMETMFTLEKCEPKNNVQKVAAGSVNQHMLPVTVPPAQ